MINWTVFLLLTIMHPIADFFTWHRGWGTSWKTRTLSEYVLAINPLHALWDMISPLRRHPLYMKAIGLRHRYIGAVWLEEDVHNTILKIGTTTTDDEKWDVMNVHWLFWRWLAVDQLAHVLLNLFAAWLIGVYW